MTNYFEAVKLLTEESSRLHTLATLNLGKYAIGRSELSLHLNNHITGVDKIAISNLVDQVLNELGAIVRIAEGSSRRPTHTTWLEVSAQQSEDATVTIFVDFETLPGLIQDIFTDTDATKVVVDAGKVVRTNAKGSQDALA
jgi:hypothetical protein